MSRTRTSAVEAEAPLEFGHALAEHEPCLCSFAMAWTTPAYSRRKVDEAGSTYVDETASAEERELARAVINNWRSSHSYPLNTMTVYLRDVARRYDHDPTVAQRIKRLPSIRHKLERIPSMKLARMQDIGGCRAVVSTVKAVDQVVGYYKTKSRIKHKLIRDDPYIQNPKSSGYRGHHLVYRYYSDKNDDYNGLQIEVQLRSRLQHAWATAVETVGTFTRQALKSSWGDQDWLRFFALMSSALALREGTPLVPNTPDDPDQLKRALRLFANRLDIVDRLTAYGVALQVVEQQMSTLKGHTFLLELDIGAQTLVARSYQNPAMAADEYSALEHAIEGDPGKDAVLVTGESLDSLRRAYPNYFLDTTAFVKSVNQAIA